MEKTTARQDRVIAKYAPTIPPDEIAKTFVYQSAVLGDAIADLRNAIADAFRQAIFKRPPQ